MSKFSNYICIFRINLRLKVTCLCINILHSSTALLEVSFQLITPIAFTVQLLPNFCWFSIILQVLLSIKAVLRNKRTLLHTPLSSFLIHTCPYKSTGKDIDCLLFFGIINEKITLLHKIVVSGANTYFVCDIFYYNQLEIICCFYYVSNNNNNNTHTLVSRRINNSLDSFYFKFKININFLFYFYISRFALTDAVLAATQNN